VNENHQQVMSQDELAFVVGNIQEQGHTSYRERVVGSDIIMTRVHAESQDAVEQEACR